MLPIAMFLQPGVPWIHHNAAVGAESLRLTADPERDARAWDYDLVVRLLLKFLQILILPFLIFGHYYNLCILSVN